MNHRPQRRKERLYARRLIDPFSAWLGTATLVVCCGCTEAERPGLYPVTGRVLIDGQPAESGAVSLRPTNAGQGHQPTGSIAADGRYEIYTAGQPGAPPGDYRVVVFMHERATAVAGAHPPLPRSLIDPLYQNPLATPLQLTVRAETSPDTFDLEVRSARSR